jgi:hemerythrin superfamily protein
MARANRIAVADFSDEEIVTDALSLLKRDHRIIERLFTEFDTAIGLQLDPLSRRICKMLNLHAKIEEEIFYPAARGVLDPKLIDEAQAEHAAMQARIARIEAMTSEHPEFEASLAVLAREVAAHVTEEERDLFPRLARANLDLEALGVALAERKETLMEVMGLHEDDELRAVAEPGSVSASAAQAAR